MMSSTLLAAPPSSPRLLDQVRERIRVKHYSLRTEQAYLGWIKRYIFFHDKRHPLDMGKAEVEAFLGALAVERNVSAATQTQALSTLLFLYREVLGIELPWLDDLVRAKKPRRLPSVLTRAEASALLGAIDNPDVIIPARLLYGSGLRLLECLRLRVKDVDVSRQEILVRDGKGQKDRVTMLPESLLLPMREQIESVRQLHVRDLAHGHGEVWLPDALSVKYPGAGW